jgi:hypothetical protein
VTVTVNNFETLTITETKAPPVTGDIGLFVDIGTEAYFSNLRKTPVSMPGVAPEQVRSALVPRRSGDCSAEADEFVTCAGSSSV